MHYFRTNRQKLIDSLQQHGLWLVIYLSILAIVAWLCSEVWEKEAFSFDRSFLLWLHQFANPQLDRLMLFFTALGDPPTVVAIFVLTIAWLIFKQRYSDVIKFAIVCVGGVIINQEMKLFFAKPRPELWQRLITDMTYSFPSGHATGSMVVYGFLAYILAKQWLKYQIYIYAIASMVIVSIGFSRLYLGVHYPTDIIAGYGIGFLWLATCLRLDFRFRR
ncbi:phosphatase PAP2 family protein [Chamaesiphon minutus]|uniref:Membrane-associated phospholipid phosphatase n=1 Tax=Chamaesiphon minutus (strain ATCC 27169 / PCC 6605) TaxID=1173020 RepID=K9UMJ4_CHAP6|nr:phosphatase PAP2 family protein [Chamaesiphon minutus]AFY95414.1 membrane-associated phospholipid phosphatase [Chamaesiphon minutus PCC 6605]